MYREKKNLILENLTRSVTTEFSSCLQIQNTSTITQLATADTQMRTHLSVGFKNSCINADLHATVEKQMSEKSVMVIRFITVALSFPIK